MPKVIDISTEYRNEFKNGNSFSDNPMDFTQNYTGVVMEKVQAKITASVQWYANADFTDTWNIDNVNNIISRSIGDFRIDGFKAGQKFVFITDYSIDPTSPQEFEATIDFIRDEGKRIDFTVTSGLVTTTGNQSDVAIRAKGNDSANYLTGLFYKFGFVENSGAIDFTSPVTGNNMTYQAGNIPRVAGANQMQPVGNIIDWVTGTTNIEFVSDSDFEQVYEITHEFVVHPWFKDGELNNLKQGIPPNEFEGSNSLKHIFTLDFRQVLSNPNTSITNDFTNILGSVGWFDENYNGLGKAYNVLSVSYQDTTTLEAVESLQAGLNTTLTIEIEKINGAIPLGQKVGLFVSLLPPQSQYQDKKTNLLDNFLYDGIYHVEGDPNSTGANIIKTLSSSIVGGNLIIVAELEYSNAQKGVLSSISNPNYIIGVSLADESLLNVNTDRLTLNADTRPYIVSGDVAGLISFDKFDIHFSGSKIGIDSGVTDFIGWNEDSLAVEFNFTLNRDSLKEAFLNTISFDLIAFNDVTNEFFKLESTNIDISGAVISSGIQQMEVSKNRGYLFEDGNQFNEVSITTGLLIGSLQNYSGVFAQKIRWEDWIKNLSADPIFYDLLQPNDGLNNKSSNYSLSNDYSIRLSVSANVQGLNDLGVSVATDYLILSPAITVNDFNVGANYTATTQIFRLSNLTEIDAPLVGEDSLLRVTFTSSLGAITDLTGFWSALKMQASSDFGQQISELSTSYLDSSGLLKPKNGFSFLDMQIVGGNAVCECLIDGSKVSNFDYNITSRIDSPLVDECFVEFMNGDCVEFMNGDLAKFQNQ